MPAKPDLESERSAVLLGDEGQRLSILRGDHGDPFLYLGPHVAVVAEQTGTVVRVLEPEAHEAEVLLEPGDQVIPLRPLGGGLFGIFLPGIESDTEYRLRLSFPNGTVRERDDPYRFPSTLSDLDLYLLAEGTHLELWNCLGANRREVAGANGWSFAVWAPNAQRVSVVGPFCAWKGAVFPMRRLGTSGVWQIFLPDSILGDGDSEVSDQSGTLYKYEILTQRGQKIFKADPVGSWCQLPPDTASRTYHSRYQWNDEEWWQRRRWADLRQGPMATYEIHLTSFARSTFDDRDPDALVNYRDLAPRVAKHVKDLGFDSVELLPIAEHPFDGSWGYQVTGYFAPTSRFGSPDDFRFFVDHLHQEGIAVIVDWVPAHFVKDGHGLGRFDGSALYEHEDPRRGEHPDWGTYVFNYGRYEVRNFLVANALYWLEEFHVDGLRVDAVASMLYLDYSRKEGEWLPNHHGGNENYEALECLREVNRRIAERCPGCFTIAEESTAWPGITKPTEEGGLGFTFKWNMGWMHDTLDYFQIDPYFRSHHHDKLTFAMVYEYSEAYVNPLSHDEVVHGKRSLWSKMPGDAWRKAAHLRALFAYQFTRPGKILLFMGSELGSPREWNHEGGLDHYLLGDPYRKGLRDFVVALGRLYRETPAFWRLDHEPAGFQWLAVEDRSRSVFAFARYAEPAEVVLDDDEDSTSLVKSWKVPDLHALVALNLTPVPRDDYRIGVPAAGSYRVALCSDDESFGGSGYPRAKTVTADGTPCDGWRDSLQLTLPPLSAMVLLPKR
ncbi:MAG: 1,4-alpha-glucan branching protein GlgB [Thermoanaerobaculia bacterium]|nr:1,4-alpha-glucan branching protein GlgB [Thermoanaerobaculia bacterium]